MSTRPKFYKSVANNAYEWTPVHQHGQLRAAGIIDTRKEEDAEFEPSALVKRINAETERKIAKKRLDSRQ